jgi:hypothetical protein
MDCEDVLKIQLPRNVVCAGERLITSGHDRMTYTYQACLKGEEPSLSACIQLLDLKELDPETYKGARYMRKEPMEYWNPPSLETKHVSYRLFEGNKGDPLSRPAKGFQFTQAEMTSNSLYVYQIGYIASLRDPGRANDRGTTGDRRNRREVSEDAD